MFKSIWSKVVSFFHAVAAKVRTVLGGLGTAVARVAGPVVEVAKLAAPAITTVLKGIVVLLILNAMAEVVTTIGMAIGMAIGAVLGVFICIALMLAVANNIFWAFAQAEDMVSSAVSWAAQPATYVSAAA